MKIIVGLGNPGNKYQNTKHNTGFLILDNYARKNGLTWENNSKFKSEIIRISSSCLSSQSQLLGNNDVILVKPQTFMNDSGTAASQVLSYFNTPPEQLLVIHDDVDLEFGKIKKSLGSSAAGHHGVQDIIDKLGTQQFWRLRVGVGRPANNNYDVEDWVLTTFSEKELEFISSIEPPLDF